MTVDDASFKHSEKYSYSIAASTIYLQTIIDQVFRNSELGVSDLLFIAAEAIRRRVEARKQIRTERLREIIHVMPITVAEANEMADVYDSADRALAEEIERLAFQVADRNGLRTDLQTLVDDVISRRES